MLPVIGSADHCWCGEEKHHYLKGLPEEEWLVALHPPVEGKTPWREEGGQK